MVELAVERASDPELNKLECLLEEMTHLVEAVRVEEYSKRDIRFHHFIAQAAHNRFLLHLFTAIRRFLDQFIRESFTLLPEALNISQRGHHANPGSLEGEKQKAGGCRNDPTYKNRSRDTAKTASHARILEAKKGYSEIFKKATPGKFRR